MHHENSARSQRISSYTWAKIYPGPEKITAWCPLGEHCLDVAAVVRALLDVDCLRNRLETLVGAPKFSEARCDRLAILAGLHDLGKANHGFRAKAVPAALHTATAGHVKEIAALLRNASDPEARRIVSAIRIAELVTWFEDDEPGLINGLLASWCHHGRIIEQDAVFRGDLWRRRNGIDPVEDLKKVANQVFDAYPGAVNATPFPSRPEFAHALMGLVTLADWIASDTRFFPLFAVDGLVTGRANRRVIAEQALRDIGMDVGRWRNLAFQREFDFISVFGREPRPAQAEVLTRALPTAPSTLILEADTGSGKTEAAMTWFARMFAAGQVDALYFALPTRAAATQIYRRVCAFAERWLGPDHPPVVLAVPGYLSVDGREGQLLPGFEVLWPDNEGERFRFRTWAAEHPKRYFSGSMVVGTVDQVLLSALQVSHSHMRGFSLLRHLLVVDEVHSSDAYMTRILEEVVQRTEKAGGHVVLMSATLGSRTRARFLRNPEPGPEAAVAVPYPQLSVRDGAGQMLKSLVHHAPDRTISVSIEQIIGDTAQIAARAVGAAQQGARVAVIRNTVSGVIALQESLEAIAHREQLFSCRGVLAPHHGRYARTDRKLLDQALEDRLRQDRPVVVAATQTIEQSLDIDFDLLITDLCPMDVLLQRIGRLHRHQRTRPADYRLPQVVVLVPDQPLDQYIQRHGTARGPHGLGTVYYDLGVLEATLGVLLQTPVLRLPADNRTLVERTTHPAILEQRARQLGSSWDALRQNVWGMQLGQRNLAAINTMRWDQPLMNVSPAEPGKEIMTRLGQRDYLVRFDCPGPGPFHQPVDVLTVPGHLAPQLVELGPDLAPEEIAHLPEGGFCFELGGLRFEYSRLGLRRKGEE
jgi:CRISPR-associated endonuclease/helicase Cas3